MWQCKYCNAENEDTVQVCKSCLRKKEIEKEEAKSLKQPINKLALISVLMYDVGFLLVWNKFFGWAYALMGLTWFVYFLVALIIISSIISVIKCWNIWLIVLGISSFMGTISSLRIYQDFGLYLCLIGSIGMIVVGIKGIFTKKDIQKIKNTTEQIINDSTDSVKQTTNKINDIVQKMSNKTDKFEELEKYKNLLDKGVLSQEEFDKKKKELLSL